MTRAEFAALPAAVHHAVWKADAEKRISVLDPGKGSSRRYNRDQVQVIAAGLGVTR